MCIVAVPCQQPPSLSPHVTDECETTRPRDVIDVILRQVYPLVTLVAAKTSAVLLTNLPTPSLVPASRPAQVFGYPGAAGMKYGQCQVAANLPPFLPCLPSYLAFLGLACLLLGRPCLMPALPPLELLA
jgi:hypothetical protein